MAYMTDNEFQNLMDEVLRIVQESASKDEAVEKLQGLIENKNSIFLGLFVNSWGKPEKGMI